MTLEEMNRSKQEQGFSLAQIAELSQVPLGTVQKIFAGVTKTPRYATRQAIERVLLESASTYLDSEKDSVSYEGKNMPAQKVSESVAYALDYREKKQGEYTLEDYYALPDDRRVELIDGFIYDMGAPRFVHQQIAGYVYAQLLNQITAKGGNCMPMISPVDVNLDKDDKTMVQPDVMIICNKDLIRKWGVSGAPEFLLEVVSPSNKWKDYITKLAKYENAGVKEYWIIDPYKRKVTVYDFTDEEGAPEVHELTGMLGLKMYDNEIQIDLDMVASMIQDWPDEE